MNKKALKTNFYQEVNKVWLSRAKIDEDKPATGAFDEVQKKLEKRTKNLFNLWFKEPNQIPENEPILKEMMKFYQMVNDWNTRKKLGANPLLKVIEEIKQKYNSFKDINQDYVEMTLKGLYTPVDFGVYSDFKDADKQILWLGTPSLILPDTTYYENQEKSAPLLKSYKEMFIKLLEHFNYNKDQADKLINDAFIFDQKLAKYSLSSEEMSEYANLYNMFEVQETKNKFNILNLEKIINTLVGQEVKSFSIENKKFLNAFNEIYSEENFKFYKARLILATIDSYASYLSDELRILSGSYKRTLLGIQSAKKKAKAAIFQTLNFFSMPFGLYYGKTYFGPKNKKNVEHMVRNMINIYKERLRNNSWLSKNTIDKAITKLDHMGVHVGYPNIIKPYYKELKTTPYEKGGDIISNVLEFNKIVSKYVFSQYLKPVNKELWSMSPAIVNAYYSPNNNQIVFPAAILDFPFYAENRSSSMNYGAIGAIIAHEISHGFDNNGALFDEKGILNNWWTEDDKKNFDIKTQKMIELFNGAKTSVGECNGKLVVSENIADCGGIRCAFEAAKLEKDFNAEDFFISWATQWRSLYREEYQKLLLVVDVHAPTILRANLQVQNMDEFYETFDIKESDEMFIPKEKRVEIW